VIAFSTSGSALRTIVEDTGDFADGDPGAGAEYGASSH
jgi:hypothetical protein